MVLRGHKALHPPQRLQWLLLGEQRSCRQGPEHCRLLSTPGTLPAGLVVAPGAGGGLGVTALSGTDLGWGGREEIWREPRGAGEQGRGRARPCLPPLDAHQECEYSPALCSLQPEPPSVLCCPYLSSPVSDSEKISRGAGAVPTGALGELKEALSSIHDEEPGSSVSHTWDSEPPGRTRLPGLRRPMTQHTQKRGEGVKECGPFGVWGEENGT